VIREPIQYLATEVIECEPQVRGTVADASVMGLARSMQEVGLQQPIRVRQDGARFIVVDGERRLRAARLIKMKEIAAIVEEKPLSVGETVQRQLVSAVQRLDLSPLEKARGIQRLQEVTGWPASEAAGKLGLSNGTVSRLLALLDLPEEIRAGVEQGKIPASAAYELSRIDDREKQASLARQVAEGSLTRDGVSNAVKSERNEKSAPTSTEVKRVTVPLGEGRSVTVTGAGTLDAFIDVLQELVALALKERAQGTELKQFARSRKESAANRAA
jgi:ParB family chromosome partitioning protein